MTIISNCSKSLFTNVPLNDAPNTSVEELHKLAIRVTELRGAMHATDSYKKIFRFVKKTVELSLLIHSLYFTFKFCKTPQVSFPDNTADGEIHQAIENLSQAKLLSFRDQIVNLKLTNEKFDNKLFLFPERFVKMCYMGLGRENLEKISQVYLASLLSPEAAKQNRAEIEKCAQLYLAYCQKTAH